MYTQADNFTGEVLYDNLTEAYLHPDAAVRSYRSTKSLERGYTRLNSLIIYDAARPCRYKKKMLEPLVKGNDPNTNMSLTQTVEADYTTTDWQ